jgi:hypothetical protein
MQLKTTLAVCAAAVGLLFAVPQSASAAPAVKDAKQVTQSNVEKTHYRGYRRGWRHRHYRRHRHYYGRRYYRRPGFGIYLGF